MKAQRSPVIVDVELSVGQDTAFCLARGCTVIAVKDPVLATAASIDRDKAGHAV